MPSPVGHALAGFIAGGILTPGRRTLRLAALFAVLGIIPDLDLLVGAHSMYTHSVGAVALIAIAAAVASAEHRLGAGLAAAAAYATHLVMDWLGDDTTPPIGIMALWPLTRDYYESQIHLFDAITRRYWLEGFWMHNLRAVAREVVILGPLAWLVWWVRWRAISRRAG